MDNVEVLEDGVLQQVAAPDHLGQHRVDTQANAQLGLRQRVRLQDVRIVLLGGISAGSLSTVAVAITPASDPERQM